LLAFDTDKTDMSEPRRIFSERREDKDPAMSWVRSYGNGRVFYASSGHNQHIFWNGPVLKIMLDGIQFAWGDPETSTTPSKNLTQVDK
jgi:type 1 glutamine amidotransferase